MVQLNIGCEDHRIPGYIGVDANPHARAVEVVAVQPGPLPYGPGEVQDIYAGHFVEHLEPWAIVDWLRDCAALLAPGGSLTLVVPDIARIRLLADSQMLVGPSCARLLLGTTQPGMQHWTLWTRARLEEALSLAGLEVDTDYDWHTDPRVRDRSASWQTGARGVRR